MVRGILRRRQRARDTDLPVGIVTFMLTDIEGSTRLWEDHPDAMEPAVAQHRRIIADAVEGNGGTLVRERGEGDSTFSVFPTAAGALAAAADAQRALVGLMLFRVRFGVHTGDATVSEDEYAAAAINRCARIREVASGGQILVSEQTYNVAAQGLPRNVSLLDLGTHRLRDLNRAMRIYQLCHADLPSDFPALRSLESGQHNLPVQLTTFIGRDDEISEVRKLLLSTRMITLTGAGGIGKTRLALQVAAQTIDVYPDGVWFVDLAPVEVGGSIPSALARALSIAEQPSRAIADTVIEHLRSRKTLLLFDNCEHLADDTTTFVGRVLRSCPEVSVLATSRESIRVPGSSTWRIPSLAVPDDTTPTENLTDYSAVRLFCERAALVRPDFALTHDTGPIVARICRRLDGVPLAIELAAASASALSISEIEERLDDRFRVLTGGGPDEPRHATLWATVDWSHSLLDEAERVLFRRLAVFAGFSLEAAEEVCSDESLPHADVVTVLGCLVDKSLVVPEERGDRMRYAMLETIAVYAMEKLQGAGEADAIADRHVAYFVTLAERAGEAVQGSDELEGLALFEAEEDNIRRALTRASGDDYLRLAIATSHYWITRGRWVEGREWLSRGLAGSDDPRALGRALVQDARLTMSQGDLATALEHAKRARDVLGRASDDHRVRAAALIGNIHQRAGERALARDAFTSALDDARTVGDDYGALTATIGLATIASMEGRTQDAVSMYDEGLTVARRLGNLRAIATVLLGRGQSDLVLANSRDATSRLDEALAIARQLGDKRLVGRCLQLLGELGQDEEDLDYAFGLHSESAAIAADLGDAVGRAVALWRLGEIAYRRGELEASERLLEESNQLFERTGVRQGHAGSLHSLGLVAVAVGDLQTAIERLKASATNAIAIGYEAGLALCLDGLAAVAVAQADGITAAKLLGAATGIWDRIDELPPRWADRDRTDALSAARRLAGGDFEVEYALGVSLSADDVSALVQ